MNIIGIIPARGGSKGIPRKNIKLLNNQPLIYYTINAAIESQYINQIYVSTDDLEIVEISRRLGANIPILRPQELAEDDTPTLPVIQHMTETIEKKYGPVDITVTLQPTSPLRTGLDIDNTIKILLDSEADAAVSVTEVETHPYIMAKVEQNRLIWLHSEQKLSRRQDFPKIYALNGAVYATKRDILIDHNTLYGQNTRAYIMPRERSIDIDDYYDFLLVETIMRKGFKNNN
jgi:CMP-N-acetylneuraminic acid synthetase